MKIDRSATPFRPIPITLETEAEATALWLALNWAHEATDKGAKNGFITKAQEDMIRTTATDMFNEFATIYPMSLMSKHG